MTHHSPEPQVKEGNTAHPRVLPSQTEPAARGFVRFLGGPPGSHAYIGQQPWWTHLRVILALSAFFLSFGWMQKANCVRTGTSPDGPFVDWSGQPQYTSACYSDIVVLYNGRGLNEGIFPYAYSWQADGVTRYLEYPVITGLFQYLMAMLTRIVSSVWSALGLPPAADAALNLGVTAVFLGACWMAACAIIAMLAGNRKWDTLLMALSPLVIVHAFTNYDVLSILFAVAAIAAWAHCKPTGAGVLAGLGIAAKLWPIFLVGAIILLCLRARQWAAMAKLIAGTVLTWIAVNLPIYLLYPQAWGEFFRLNSTRGWEGSTIYAVIAHATGRSSWEGTTPSKAVVGAEQFNMIALMLLLAALVALTVVVLTARQAPRLGQITFLVVLAFMITNKVWSPQYSLWLVPLLVLALPRWRLVLSWAAVEAVYWYLRMWTFLPHKLAAPDWLVDSFTLIRLGLLVAMAVIVVRQIYGYSPDPVRAAHGGKDPLSGVARMSSGRIKE